MTDTAKDATPAPTKEDMENQMRLSQNIYTQGMPTVEQLTVENAKNVREMLGKMSRLIDFNRGLSGLIKESGFVYLPERNVDLNPQSSTYGRVQEFMRPMEFELAKKQTGTVGIAIEFSGMLDKAVSDIPFASKHINSLMNACDEVLAAKAVQA